MIVNKVLEFEAFFSFSPLRRNFFVFQECSKNSINSKTQFGEYAWVINNNMSTGKRWPLIALFCPVIVS